MVESDQSISDAARRFAHSLAPDKHQDSQEALRFARWFGEERSASELRPVDVASYIESFGTNSPNAGARADSLKSFLAYAHKHNITRERLVSHVRVRRAANQKRPAASSGQPAEVNLTSDGQAAVEAELGNLIAQRPQIADDLHSARADGDVRENAPLEAAREAQGKLEARVRELEGMLRLAVVVDDAGSDSAPGTAHVGSSVILANLASGAELEYQIVNAAEAKPGTGRLSAESPVGLAVVGKKTGDVVEVVAPSGTVRFRVKSVTS